MSVIDISNYETKIHDFVQAHDGLSVSTIQHTGGKLVCILEADPQKGAQLETARQEIETLLNQSKAFQSVSVILTAKRGVKSSAKIAATPARIENLAPNIKHVIAVASGKGGVGKSTVAANLAVAMGMTGLRTGLMDADIYGPSVPMMLGKRFQERPPMKDKKIIPPQAHGITLMSMGFLVPEDAPMIWRGPMIQTALRQFLQDVEWGELDVLIVDMPPGTGDAQLTMAQKVPLAGAVIVSTPQDIALLDARKGINMFTQTGVPVLGLVENMSHFICPSCGHEAHIFGHGGVEQEAEKQGHPFLGAIPLDIDIRTYSDQGEPIVIKDPAHKASQQYIAIADKILTTLKIETRQKPKNTSLDHS